MFGPIALVQKIVGGVALGLILLLSLMWQIEKRRAGKFERQTISLNAELDRISDTKNRQAETTKGTVEKAKVIYRDADRVAQRIEAAPLGQQCETPREILGADL